LAKVSFSFTIFIFRFSSWFENSETNAKQFAHFESGFLKVKPNSSPLFLTYTSSHTFGVALIEEGVFDDANKIINLESTSVGRTSINKPPEVVKVSI
jgi:hypothetical protein